MINNREIIMRKFELKDIEPVYSLIVDTLDKSYAGVYPEENIDFFKEYHNKDNILHDCDKGYTIVIEYNGRIVGTGTLTGTNIRRVFVNASFQRQGLGLIIMKELERKAFEQGIRVVDLSASLVAKKFYDRLGYNTEEEKNIDIGNNRKLHYFDMIKYISRENGQLRLP